MGKKNKLIRHNQIATLERLTEDDSNVSWRYLSSDERTRLLVALNGTTRGIYTIVILALNTGIRKNALLSLKRVRWICWIKKWVYRPIYMR